MATDRSTPKNAIDERLTAEAGTFYFSGLSMLVRLVLEQARRDAAVGVDVESLITGYPGSPLGSYDLALEKIPRILDDHRVLFMPAGNEEQAMTALMGSQMVDSYPRRNSEGVAGFWYGKGPGVDRAGDALKHGNFAGTSRLGSVVVLSGEDHEAKSSTMPFQEDWNFVAAGVPILYPSTVAEFRTMGLHATALSRFSGCWVALKLVSALCDGGETTAVDDTEGLVTLPQVDIDGQPFAKRADFSFYPGKNISHERHLYRDKHRAVLAYARANELNRVVSREPGDKVGIISMGKSAADTRQALLDLGLEPAALAGSGLALMDVGMPYPLDEAAVREFADGLDELIVIEEKRPFLEDAVRRAIQPVPAAIRVIGKSDDEGRPFTPVEGGFDADVLRPLLADRLAGRVAGIVAAPPVSVATPSEGVASLFNPRTPNFCSGCPHNVSTLLAPGQLAFGAPGCNCFNEVIEQPERHIETMTQYGGEGAAWVGLAPFTSLETFVQHIGDGSLFHSSYLNIRWAVATNTKVTFAVLWNGVVANTGAQLPVGQRGLEAFTRGLESEGVQRIVIATKEPNRYRGARLAPGTEIRHADTFVATSEELGELNGVKVLIYDESCANERRRRIKRGKLAAPTTYTLINEEVCENCGDCGVQSNCMSLQKVATEYGDKTRIHASSCNQDFSCMKGDCPSFATVRVAEGTGYRKPTPATLDLEQLPAPRTREWPDDKPFHLYMPGVGGTGVLTANAVLAMAAHLDGFTVRSYDQTGAAQKWGPVVSSLTLTRGPASSVPVNRVLRGRSDLYMALDEVAAVDPVHLGRCTTTRTSAVVNTDLFPTGEMVRDVWAKPDTDGMRAAIERACHSYLGIPARRIAEDVFGDYMMTNMVAIGAACEAGEMPVSASRIEEAITLNGVAVERNIQAFRHGRLWVADRDAVLRLIEGPAPTPPDEERRRQAERLPAPSRARYHDLCHQVADASAAAGGDVELQRLVAVRVADLIRYQSTDWASRYVEGVVAVAHREGDALRLGHAAQTPGGHGLEVTRAVARYLFKLMAYKDEYEVARLYRSASWAQRVEEEFEDPVDVSFNLQPPLFRRFGAGKVNLGSWFSPVFGVLAQGRRLRGTALDPFGRQSSRRLERGLIVWYLELLAAALDQLRAENRDRVVEIAELPDLIRGYEDIKEHNAAAAKQRARMLLDSLAANAPEPAPFRPAPVPVRLGLTNRSLQPH